MDNRPIGMFDSGCGGLTVLKEYIKKLPNEDFIYYGDTAHLPYGDKSPSTILKYSEEILGFLINKNVKMIVIACGTASAISYKFLKNKYNIEIKNIIEPAVKSLKDTNIGVIATKATINSNAWENAILKMHPSAKVTSVACPLFVPLIEEGFIENPATDFVIKEYMKNFDGKNISSLILGCTHYPLLKEKIKKSFDYEINLIDVGEASALDTKSYLDENMLNNDRNHIGTCSFFSSDDFNDFINKAKCIGIDVE